MCIIFIILILSRPLEAVIPREPPIVQEITSVIREWGAIWKQLYVVSILFIIFIQRNKYIEWKEYLVSL